MDRKILPFKLENFSIPYTFNVSDIENIIHKKQTNDIPSFMYM